MREMRNVVAYGTTDPDKLMVEYELVDTVPGTGRREGTLFVAVLEVRDGLMALWREYQLDQELTPA